MKKEIGTCINDYTIISLVDKDKVEIQCSKCNHKKIIQWNFFIKNLNHHNGFNCKQDYRNLFVNQIFDDFKITECFSIKGTTKVKGTCIICFSEYTLNLGDVLNHEGTQHKCCQKRIIQQLNDGSKEFQKFYLAWYDFRKRTTDPTYTAYHQGYGNRGISSEYYKDYYQEFRQEYQKNNSISIDRINNDGNYEYGNLRWTTPIVQSNNQRIKKSCKWFIAIAPDGKQYREQIITKFAKEHSLDYSTIHGCLKRTLAQHKGWKFHYEE